MHILRGCPKCQTVSHWAPNFATTFSVNKILRNSEFLKGPLVQNVFSAFKSFGANLKKRPKRKNVDQNFNNLPQ